MSEFGGRLMWAFRVGTSRTWLATRLKRRRTNEEGT